MTQQGSVCFIIKKVDSVTVQLWNQKQTRDKQ